jgi:hypothetical protein
MKRGIWGRTLIGIAALCLVASAATAAAKGKEPIVGSWELDATKSSATGRPALKSAHAVISVVKNGLSGVVDAVPGSGPAVHYEWAGKYDGSDIHVNGNAYYDTFTVLKADKNTLIRTERRGGKVVGITTIEVAKDGKTMTASTRATLPDGHQFTANSVYNRVKK